jgi:hypothetical protein
MKLSGWLETENGAELFDVEGATFKACAKELRTDYPEDAGWTDMEATNADGDDVTRKLYDGFENL